MAQVGTQIVMGWSGFGSSGLSFGYLLRRLVNVAILLRGSHLGRPPGLGCSSTDCWQMVQDATVASVANCHEHPWTSAITPWVARQYGLGAAGSFAFALQILSVPAALVGQAVATILFPRLADAERRSGVDGATMERVVTSLASVALPVFLPILVLGPELPGSDLVRIGRRLELSLRFSRRGSRRTSSPPT